MSKKIFWIASYPKSGNTWIRSIIAGLFYTNDGIFDFTKLNYIKYFENNARFSFIKKINQEHFDNLKKIEIVSKYWVRAQKNITVASGDFNFFKTHSANIKINNNHYTHKDNVLGLIYIVRDPRDISISYAAHKGTSIDKIIQIMKNKNSLTYTNGLPILQSSWDVHYLSWINLSVPKIIIKYENILKNPEKNILNIVNFLTKNYKFKFSNLDQKINNILKTTNFLELQKKEGSQGFNEATTNSPFFRKGKSNQWKDILNDNQIKIIGQNFKKVMDELKY